MNMPEVLAGAVEATVASWLVAPGDHVDVGTILAEVETEKALIDLPSDAAGTIGELLVAAGTTVSVGTPLVTILEGTAAASMGSPAAPAARVAVDEPPPPEQTPKFVHAEAPAGSPNPTVDSPLPLAPPNTPQVQRAGHGRIFASPLARRLAEERGLDLAKIPGRGPKGRVTRRDVDLASASMPSASNTPAAPPPSSGAAMSAHLMPHSPMRRAIARRLTEAKATVPHFYLRGDCRVDALLQMRQQISEELQGPRISVNDMVVKAVAVALTRVPDANVSWSEDGTVVHDAVDIAVAVSTGKGLVTPVARGGDRLALGALSATIADLAERARAGRLKQHELEGGSFTVSNLGMHGVREFAAIINPPQAGILAVGAAEQRPVVVGGHLEVARVMTVTLSADHRVLDGEAAARWMAAFKAAIEAPLSLLV